MVADAELEDIFTPGPHRAWNVGRQGDSVGAISGIWYRGSDQLKYAVADIIRCIDIGVRGFLVVGGGLLRMLNKMRENGDTPKDVVFKVSLAESYGGFMRFYGAPEMVGVTTSCYFSNDGRCEMK